MVYIVLLESGGIHSVHSTAAKADKVATQLESIYENAIVKRFELK